MSRRPDWRDRFPEEVTCVRCLEVRDVGDLDRLLWCDDCQAAAKDRAWRLSWVVGVVCAALLAAWVWLVIQPSMDLIPGAWIGTVVAAVWVGARVSREMLYGWMRFRNRRAVEASPPSEPSQPG